MIKYSVRKNGIITNSWTSEFADHTHYESCFGLPERPELDADGNPTGVILPAEYTVEIVDLDQDPAWLLEQCIAKRKAEYPSPEEYMDAFFDGGQAALDALQAQRLAIKAKYPKP